MPLVKASEAPKFELGGNQFTGLLSPERGSSELCSWILETAPGTGGAPHWLDREELFMVLEGRLAIQVNEDWTEVEAGDAFAVPAGAMMAVENRTDKPARAVVCIQAGFKATMAGGEEVGTPPWAK